MQWNVIAVEIELNSNTYASFGGKTEKLSVRTTLLFNSRLPL